MYSADSKIVVCFMQQNIIICRWGAILSYSLWTNLQFRYDLRWTQWGCELRRIMACRMERFTGREAWGKGQQSPLCCNSAEVCSRLRRSPFGMLIAVHLLNIFLKWKMQVVSIRGISSEAWVARILVSGIHAISLFWFLVKHRDILFNDWCKMVKT